MDLELLEATLRERGEPAYRFAQVWDWAAGGAAGYDRVEGKPGFSPPIRPVANGGGGASGRINPHDDPAHILVRL